MTDERRTTWRLRRIPDTAFGLLDVTLTVDTTAPAVVDAIELAASENGIALERTRVAELEQEHEATDG